jgi:NAD(P)-dependent dehydrogenase (short-subunit alcohol dehydrogenase family)
MRLANKMAVVTGAARGMGRAIVQGLLAEGASVAALDRSWNSSENTPTDPARLLTLTADVTDERALGQAFDRTLGAFGTVDIIVNNAGYRQRDVEPSAVTRLLDVPPEQWLRMFAVNALGLVLVTRRFVAPMIGKRSGSVINITSRAGVLGRPGDQPYGASKAAATNLSQAMAAELEAFNVAVNIVFPPTARTTGYEEQTRLRAERTGRRPSAAPWKPEAIVPVVLSLAELVDARTTGLTFSVPEWNQEHGFGGAEVWSSPDP